MGILPNAVLVIESPEYSDLHIAVPVTNFPVLPVGSKIYLYFDDKAHIESGEITAYSANSKRGTEIDIEIDAENLERAAKIWSSIAKICVRDTNGLCTYLYPRSIDFNKVYLLKE